MTKVKLIKQCSTAFFVGWCAFALAGCSSWSNRWESKFLNERAAVCTEAAKYSLNDLFFVTDVNSQKFQIYRHLITVCKEQLDSIANTTECVTRGGSDECKSRE